MRPGEGASVVLVEEHLALREGLAMLLRQAGHRVAGVAGSAEEAFAVVVRSRPDVVVTGLRLPDVSGVELCRRLVEADPACRVLVFTGIEDADLLAEALDCGARGVAMKTASPSELIDAIVTVAQGGEYFDPHLGGLLETPTGRAQPVLSRREREVLTLLARGSTGEEIARALVLSPETVRTHVRNAMGKLGAKTRAQAIALALARGEITLRLRE